jgi:hypothetical protein
MHRAPYARLACFLVVLLVSPGALAGQLISLKTVPVAAGDQFLIYPSENVAMGGVAIALDDPLLDPFLNPAMGALFTEPQAFSAPTFYSISNNAGSARTLPAGALFASRGWFGGALGALQQLKRGEQFFGPVPLFDDVVPPNALSRQSATNKYGHVSFGRRLASDVAVGASAFFADLNAMDGVEHLYALASDVAQAGDITNLRLGLLKEFAGDGRLEAVVLHHRFSMTHDVTYVDWVLVDSTNWMWEQQTRVEFEQDRSRTWGAHLGYHQPVGTDGWRVGGILTANRKSHPKIPNYEIMNIPRDPGHSNAFNIGIGLAKVTEQTTFGIDIIYEPASSETWAEADGPVEKVNGDTIPDGGKTIENSFDFSNAYVNLGVMHRVGPAAFQLGIKVRAYDFHLDQWDNIEETARRQDENWMEWVPSWGARIKLADLELRYFGRVTTGTGRPGVAWSGAVAERALDASSANDILLPPSGPLTLQDATVMTHQFSVSIPIR